VAGCHSFWFIFHIFFITYIHSFNHIHTIYISVAIRWGLSPSPHRLKAQWEDPPCGAKPRIELGPALQQADALPTEPRRMMKNMMCNFQKVYLANRTARQQQDGEKKKTDEFCSTV
jgi:hypothetical protein